MGGVRTQREESVVRGGVSIKGRSQLTVGGVCSQGEKSAHSGWSQLWAGQEVLTCNKVLNWSNLPYCEMIFIRFS